MSVADLVIQSWSSSGIARTKISRASSSSAYGTTLAPAPAGRVCSAPAGQWENFFSRFPQPLGFRGDVSMAGEHATSPQDAQNTRYFPGPSDAM